MSAQQTSSGQSAKRQNRAPRRNWPTKSTLNISRKILEKSVIQQNRHIESIQQNNIQLARRVSELQKELSERTAELQICREESFQLQIKLNRLQNNSAESALHALREKLASMTEDMFKAHEFAARVCSELAAPEASLCPGDTPLLRKSDNSMPVECTVAVSPGGDENFRSSNDATLRSSAQSVEMELDTSDFGSKSFVGYPTGRKTLAPPPANESDVVASPPAPFQARKSSPAVSFQNIESQSPTHLRTRTSSPPIQSISSCPDEDDEDYMPKPKRKRIPLVKKAKKTRRAANAVAVDETTGPTSSRAVNSDQFSDAQPTDACPPSVAVSAIASSNQPEMDLNQGEKNENKAGGAVLPVPKSPPRQQSRRRRKRLRLIADDSVFIPISDSMLEDAASGNKENVAKTSSLSTSEAVKQKGGRVEENVEVNEVKFAEPGPVAKGSTSQVPEESSDPPTSPIRTRRKLDPVSYVVKLNTKLRQGDQNWCRY